MRRTVPRRAGKTFYAVLEGHLPGIYRTWEECRRQVDGYSNAVYRAFPTRAAAEDYCSGVAKTVSPAGDSPLNDKEDKDDKDDKEVLIPCLVPPMAQSSTMKQVVIYADGACMRNPGPGGYGVVLSYQNQERELSGGFRLTTNNRMEILGCIAGLLALKESCDVTVYSDSRYVVDAMSKSWALKWKRNAWKRRDPQGEEKPVLNQDLWIQMLDLCGKHQTRFKWVRGHTGVDGNERCDQLARAAAKASGLGIDLGYERLA